MYVQTHSENQIVFRTQTFKKSGKMKKTTREEITTLLQTIKKSGTKKNEANRITNAS